MSNSEFYDHIIMKNGLKYNQDKLVFNILKNR